MHLFKLEERVSDAIDISVSMKTNIRVEDFLSNIKPLSIQSSVKHK